MIMTRARIPGWLILVGAVGSVTPQSLHGQATAAPESRFGVSLDGFGGSAKMARCFANATFCGAKLYGAGVHLEYRGSPGWATGVAAAYYTGPQMVFRVYRDNPDNGNRSTDAMSTGMFDAVLFARRHAGRLFVEGAAGVARINYPIPTWCGEIGDYRGAWICGTSLVRVKPGPSLRASAGFDLLRTRLGSLAIQSTISRITGASVEYRRRYYDLESDDIRTVDDSFVPQAIAVTFGLRIRR